MLWRKTSTSMKCWLRHTTLTTPKDDDKMETDVEKNEEPGNLEQAWQMFDLAKVNLHTYCSVDINSCRLSMGKQRTK